jgi:hypothetical protein
VIGIALYFCDVCGLPKQTSEIFKALIVSDVNKATISDREKLENIHASVPFNSVCQKFSGLISGVMPKL